MRNKIIAWFMAHFFSLLYNQFAWMYDLVANLVSFGEWNTWVATITKQIKLTPTLELGIGPGHLQKSLHKRRIPIFGLDLSFNMVHISSLRLQLSGFTPHLMQASSTAIPFPNMFFEQVICTFPSEYIFESQTLAEIRRVLTQSGKLIVLFSANISGGSLPQKLLAHIYRITGQSINLNDQVLARLRDLFRTYNFELQVSANKTNFYTLTYLVATLVE